jgi:ubiquinone/menaquinone biosynthesis C-methylase UbiE
LDREQIIHSYDEKHALTNQFLPDEGLYRWVLKLCQLQRGMNLLDVACGMGMMVREGIKNGLKCQGVDISYQAIKRGRKELNLDSISVADGERLPYPEHSFDIVTNIGSLEHFISIEDGLNEMRRVAKKDGTVAIYLPNSYYLIDVLWEVGRTGYGPTHSQIIERFATFGEWRDLIEAHGLSVKKARGYNFRFPRTRKDWKFVAQRPQRLLKALSSIFIPFNLSYSFLFICSPK